MKNFIINISIVIFVGWGSPTVQPASQILKTFEYLSKMTKHVTRRIFTGNYKAIKFLIILNNITFVFLLLSQLDKFSFYIELLKF